MKKRARTSEHRRTVHRIAAPIPGADWLRLAHRAVTFLRGVRGDDLDTIEADHRREVERSSKLQNLYSRIDNSAGEE